MTATTPSSTSDPVVQLTLLGEPGCREPWPDYLAFGLGPEHVPSVVRLLRRTPLGVPDERKPGWWAPLHAWRALGQLGAVEAVPRLLEYLVENDDDDWAAEEIPEVLLMLGPPAFSPLEDFLADPRNGVFPRLSVIPTLTRFAEDYPELRPDAIRAARQGLRRAPSDDPTVNGYFVAELVEMKAPEAIEEIRAAYKGGFVDQSICGDLEGVEVDLGLRKRKPPKGPKIYPAAPPPQPSSPLSAAFRAAGRNEPCPCGSGIKYKKCCLNRRNG